METGRNNLIPVSIYFSETVTKSQWKQLSWHLDGVLLAKKQERLIENEQVYTSNENGHQIMQWEGLQVELNRNSCSAYYDNLSSSNPKIFVICHGDYQDKPTPFVVTLDLSEAEAYMETGEQVYSTTLIPDLYFSLEQFVMDNYIPETPKKRRRKS